MQRCAYLVYNGVCGAVVGQRSIFGYGSVKRSY